MTMTKLTVLMTVYNSESYLREAVRSILNQTYRDFKFLIIDNASTDISRELIRSFNDPRIELVALSENIGQVAALNKGLDMIDTPLVARMDADDISMPRRFERQVEFMDSHPTVGVCGTFVITFDGGKKNRYNWPCQSPDIKVKLLFECTIAHPSVMIRKSFFDKFKLRYNEKAGHSEDWELWQRASQYFALANIPEYLLRYRIHKDNESFKIFNRQKDVAEKMDTVTLKFLGLENHSLRSTHRDVAFETFNVKNRESKFIDDVVRWFNTLRTANKSRRIYLEDSLERFLSERLFIVLNLNIKHRSKALRLFFNEGLYRNVGFLRSAKFIIKITLSFLGMYKVK